MGQVILRNRGVTFKRDKLLKVLLLVRSYMNTKLRVRVSWGFFFVLFFFFVTDSYTPFKPQAAPALHHTALGTC